MSKKTTRASVTVTGGAYLHRALMRTGDRIRSAVKRAVKQEARRIAGGGRKRR